MTPRNLIALGLGAWLTSFVFAQAAADRELLARAAADRAAAPTAESAAPTAPAPADALDAEEALARRDATMAQLRLELVIARKALRAGDMAEAATRAHQVLALAAGLPSDLDLSEQELQAEGILARAARAGLDVERGGAVRSNDGALTERLREDETRRLIEAREALIAPAREITFSFDWPRISASRERYAGGQMVRGRSWTDPQGQEWYPALYDLRELTYVTPDFAPSFSLDASENYRNTADRAALRWGSSIFNGTAYDLAAGIPLLQYFGGVDEDALRGPKYSLEKQRQIVQMIDAFLRQSTEPQMIPLLP